MALLSIPIPDPATCAHRHLRTSVSVLQCSLVASRCHLASGKELAAVSQRFSGNRCPSPEPPKHPACCPTSACLSSCEAAANREDKQEAYDEPANPAHSRDTSLPAPRHHHS